MPTLYTASPKIISKLEMNKVGTGSEMSRYAHGLYLGSPSTAIHYLNTYKDYKPADLSLKHQGVEFDVKTDAGRMAVALINNSFNVNAAKNELHGDKNAIDALEDLVDLNGTPKFKYQRGGLHQVNFSISSSGEVPHWDQTLSIGQIIEIYQTLIDTKMEQGFINNANFDDMTPSDKMDDLFDEAYESVLDEGEFNLNSDIEIYRNIWFANAMGENFPSEFDKHTDDFNDAFSSTPHHKKMMAISKLMDAHFNEDMSYGDIYHQVAHALTRNNEDGRVNASAFFDQKMGISMIEAEAMQGGPNQSEFIILSQKFADSCKIDVVDPRQANELEYNPPNRQCGYDEDTPEAHLRRTY
jgi:hypothetical protein